MDIKKEMFIIILFRVNYVYKISYSIINVFTMKNIFLDEKPEYVKFKHT